MLSTYGPKVFDSIKQKGRGGVFAVLEPGTPTFGLDFKMFYTYAMMYHKTLPVLNLFITWEAIEGDWTEYPTGTLFFCTYNGEPTLYCDKTHAECFKENLIEIEPEHRPVPQLALVCDTEYNPMPAAIKHFWNDDTMTREQKKGTIVRMWGQGHEA